MLHQFADVMREVASGSQLLRHQMELLLCDPLQQSWTKVRPHRLPLKPACAFETCAPGRPQYAVRALHHPYQTTLHLPPWVFSSPAPLPALAPRTFSPASPRSLCLGTTKTRKQIRTDGASPRQSLRGDARGCLSSHYCKMKEAAGGRGRMRQRRWWWEGLPERLGRSHLSLPRHECKEKEGNGEGGRAGGVGEGRACCKR